MRCTIIKKIKYYEEERTKRKVKPSFSFVVGPLTALPIPQKLIQPRSKDWPKVRKEHLRLQPTCQACNSKTKLEVHHIVPVHIDPTKELVPGNMLTLCENPKTGFCHFIFGHLAISWFKWDPEVIYNAKIHNVAVTYAQTQEDVKGKPI
jgi:hypothetical protein